MKKLLYASVKTVPYSFFAFQVIVKAAAGEIVMSGSRILLVLSVSRSKSIVGIYQLG